MKHALALILLSAAAFVGCDSKLFSDGDDNLKAKGGIQVGVGSIGGLYPESSKGKALRDPINVSYHSLEDFIYLQRMEQVEKTLETIRSLEKEVQSSDTDSRQKRELRKEIFETRTQLLVILSSIEDAKFIFVP